MSLDLSLFELITVTLKNSFFDSIMPVLSDAGYWKLPLLIFVLSMGVFGKKKGLLVMGLCIIAVGLSDAVCGNMLKPLFHRPRPLNGVTFSFPSNHTANLVAAATVLSYFYRRYWVALTSFGIAALVGYSRVYTTSHYPTDVLGGALVGAFFAFLVIECYLWISARIQAGKNKQHVQ